MSAVWTIARRELLGYFITPLAYVFIVMFLVLSGALTFLLGQWYERGQADLIPFFNFHPWLYLLLVSAVAMRLWAEERRSGTMELLLTMPITLMQAVLGKFLAAWLVIGAALALTTPMWWTVNYLGDPDNGVIAASYLGSWLMAAAFLAQGACLSAATSNQVVAFISSVALGFLFVIIGFAPVVDFLHGPLGTSADLLASLSFLTHFQAMAKGVLSIEDVVFFVVLTAGWLTATAIVIRLRQSG